MAKLETVVIAAVARNRVIGRDGSLPWHYPEDLEHFRELTTGNAVAMGRRTFEDIESKLDGPLPDRLNIVLTRSGIDADYESVREANSLEEAREIAEEEGFSELYVAGGASVYEQFLEAADRIELTRIHDEYDGDTRFPEVDWSKWEEVSRDEREELSFVSFERAGKK